MAAISNCCIGTIEWSPVRVPQVLRLGFDQLP